MLRTVHINAFYQIESREDAYSLSKMLSSRAKAARRIA